jgi:hypothetical protein
MHIYVCCSFIVCDVLWNVTHSGNLCYRGIGNLKKLRRLDIGNNEIEVLPVEVGELIELTELWLDSNCLSELPEVRYKCCVVYVHIVP